MDFNSILKVIRLFDSKQQMIDIIQDWQQSKHPRGNGGKFAPSGGASNNGKSDNFDAFKAGKPIGGLSPQDYKREKLDPDFNDPDWIKKGIEFNKKQAHARGLALRQMVKNPSSAKNYAYLWIDGQDGIPEQVQDGGAGSGNFGHKGRAGKRGGSSKRGQGGGAQHIKRQAMSAAKKADNDKFKGVTQRALQRLPVGTTICSGKQDSDGWSYRKSEDGLWRLPDSQDGLTDQQLSRSVSYDDQESFYRAATKGQAQLWQEDNNNWKRAREIIQAKKKKDDAVKNWKQRVTEEMKAKIGGFTSRSVMRMQPNEVFEQDVYSRRVNGFLQMAGLTIGLDKRIQQGKFENLDREQQDQLKQMLDLFDLDDGFIPVKGDKTDQLYYNTSIKARDLIRWLQMKQMGFDVPAQKPGVPQYFKLAKEHPKAFGYVIPPKAAGYTVSTAGDSARASVSKHIKENFNVLPEKVRNKLASSVQGIDDDLASRIMQSISQLSLHYAETAPNISGGGNCYCAGDMISMAFFPSWMGDDRKQSQLDDSDPLYERFVHVFWHQFGHFLDNRRDCTVGLDEKSHGVTYRGFTKTLEDNRMLDYAASDDISQLMDKMEVDPQSSFYIHVSSYDGSRFLRRVNKKTGQDHIVESGSDQCNEICEKLQSSIYNMYGIKSRQQWQEQNGFPRRVPMKKYAEGTYMQYDYDIDGYVVKPKDFISTQLQVEYYDKVQRYKKRLQAFKKKNPGIQDGWVQNQRKWRLFNNSADSLNDILGQFTHGTLRLPNGGGVHSAQYYKSRGLGTQTTANFISAYCTGKSYADPASGYSYMLSVLRNLFPKTHAAYRDTIRSKDYYGD